MPAVESAVDLGRVRRDQRRAWQEEWPFTVQLIPLSALFADERYQREPIRPFIEAKAQEFDPTLVGTLDTSARSNGQFAILDGLQRTEIMRLVDKKACYCAVYPDMGVRDEAEFFFRKNRDRRNMHPYYALRARSVAGEKGPTEMFKIVEKAGFRLASSTRGAEIIVAVSAVEEVYSMTAVRRAEGEALARALDVVKEAYFGMDSSTEGTVLRALGRFFQAYLDDEVIWDHLIGNLSALRPRQLLGFAADRVATSRNPKAYLAAEELVKAYNRGLRKDQRLPTTFLNAATRKRVGR